MQSTMIQSAAALPLEFNFEWGQAIAPGDTLTQVNPSTPLFVVPAQASQIKNYAYRDYELHYRDNVIASELQWLGYHCSEIFGNNPPRILLPTLVLDILNDALADRDPTVSTPGAVGYVDVGDAPVTALVTDKNLYTRDLILHEVLARCGLLFVSNPISSLEPSAVIDNTWSKADAYRNPRDVGFNRELNVPLFKLPDQHCAWRDNVLAPYIAALNKYLLQPLENAQRLWIKVSGTNPRENELYVLISDTATERVFAAEPFLPNRLRLIFDKVNTTLQWVTEDGSQYHIPQVVIWGIPTIAPVNPINWTGFPGQTIETIADHPSKSDSQWHRQKARFINFRTEVDTYEYYDDVSALGSNSLNQANQFTSFTLPVTLQSGTYELVLSFKETSTTTARSRYKLQCVMAAQTQVAEFAALPNRLDTLSFTFTLASTFAFPLIALTLLDFDPAYTLTLQKVQLVKTAAALPTPDTICFREWRTELLERAVREVSNSYLQSISTSIPVVEYRTICGDTATALSIATKVNSTETQSFTSDLDGNVIMNGTSIYYYLGANDIRCRGIKGVNVGDQIVIWDGGYANSTPPVSVRTVTSIDLDGDGVTYIYGLNYGLEGGSSVTGRCMRLPAEGEQWVLFPSKGDAVIRTITAIITPDQSNQGQVLATLSSPVGTSATVGKCVAIGTKSALFTAIGLPTGLTISQHTGIISGTPTQTGSFTSTINTVNGVVSTQTILFNITTSAQDSLAVWSQASTEKWMNTIESSDTRLRQAFRVGRPFDIGRPALVPAGLILKASGNVEALYSAISSIPKTTAFQPWMLELGIYVADDDFWNPRLLI